jgi:integrase
MALLEAGVPAEVIALYLGHESPTTTHLYVEASLVMKQQVLRKLNPPRCQRLGLHLTKDEFRFLDAI